MFKVVGGAFLFGALFVFGLQVKQWYDEGKLPEVDPRQDEYSICVGRFMTDMTTFVDCVGDHASKKCILDPHKMTNGEDQHNCLSQITTIPNLSFNAKIIKTASDVCYTYLKSATECLGLAVEVEEYSPCFRKEVFSRVGKVVNKCKEDAGLGDDPNFDAGAWGSAYGRALKTVSLDVKKVFSGKRKMAKMFSITTAIFRIVKNENPAYALRYMYRNLVRYVHRQR